MQHRNVLSQLRRFAGLALLAAMVGAPSAHAEATDSFPLLALLTPSTSLSVSTPEDALTVHELRPAPQLPNTIDLTAPTDDLWVRIRNGFSMPNLNDDMVLYHQQWFQSHPDYLRRVVDRSRRYMHHIVEELEKRGMPTELALLPMVESSFNPMAYSRAHASGLWQFIPATGKRFNLEQNWWHDQRRDIVASTSAALDYLQQIYEMNGDWQLALASYNWGEGAVKRAVEKNAARGLPTDFSSLTMPSETRHYVPKLQALKNIFANPRLMAELRLPELLNRPHFATVETSRPMDVTTAARLAKMPVEEFVALNPAHNRPVIKADTTLVIPADKVESFQNNLEGHDAPLTQWQAYTLKSGERLEKVAPRFGITLADLRRVNGVQGKLRLGAGSTVLVPAGKGAADLEDLPATPTLPQIVEPEPTAKGKKLSQAELRAEKSRVGSIKGGKLARADGRLTARHGAVRIAERSERKGAGHPVAGASRVAARTIAPPHKAAVAKPNAKVAKAGSGRRT